MNAALILLSICFGLWGTMFVVTWWGFWLAEKRLEWMRAAAFVLFIVGLLFGIVALAVNP